MWFQRVFERIDHGVRRPCGGGSLFGLVRVPSFTTPPIVQFPPKPEKRLTTHVQFAIEMMALYRGQVSSLSRERRLP